LKSYGRLPQLPQFHPLGDEMGLSRVRYFGNPS
jgi:hypothetical protein